MKATFLFHFFSAGAAAFFNAELSAQTVDVLADNAAGWAYLHSLDGTNNGMDPDLLDADFDASWFDQDFGAYVGATSYNGPAFIGGATAPFDYGGVSGITPGTILTVPVSGTRYTTYFLYELDGGASGYSNLSLTLLADDGAFVYLNGNRIAAKNLNGDLADTWELQTGAIGSETDFSLVPILGTTQPLVKPGPNLLAVSVHQVSTTSTDLGFRIRLRGEVGLPDIGAVYPRNLTHTSADLTWCTNQAGNSTVNYGLAPGSLNAMATLPGSRTDHRVSLSGLIPNTTYYFEAVSTDGGSFTASESGSFTTSEDPAGIRLVRGPYLQSASDDRITICWRTDIPGNSTVRYGTTQGVLGESVTVAGTRTNHEVTLTGLVASTSYFYRVETDDGAGKSGRSPTNADHFFRTSPPSGTAEPTRIWVIGDSGTANSDAANVYNSFRSYNGQDHTDVWLMLGDNAYSNGTDQEYQEAVFDMYPELLRNTHLWPTFGNHDSYTSGGAPYFSMFHFPTGGECGGVASGTEAYYSFDHGNIHFVCLDSQTSGNYNDKLGGGGMADWLQADLEATAADWIIAYFHHGPYTKGSHDSDTESQHIAIRGNLLSILEQYGTDLILSGHSHSYERSRLINGHYGSSSTYVAGTHAIDAGNGSEVGSIDGSGNFVLSGADGAYQKPLATGNAGQVSSIVGSSGLVSNWTNGSSALVNPAPHPVFIANLRLLGSMVVDIDGHRLHAVYLDSNGKVRDDFTILKGSTLSVGATDASMTEESVDNSATLMITRTGATDLPLTIDYVLSGTASAADYTPPLSGTLNFGVGETSQPIDLSITADDKAEGPETLTLTLIPRTNTITETSVARDRYFLSSPSSATVDLGDQSAEDWWFTNFGAATLDDASWAFDHDRDGFSALSEYGLGGDPNQASRSIAPEAVLTSSSFELHYMRDNSKTDVQYRVLSSTDLVDWSPTGVVDTIDGTPNPSGPEAHKAAVSVEDPQRFLTLEILLH
jgi:hypothetical protein